MAKRESKPIEFEGETYSSVRELADEKFQGRYNAAYQMVFRYQRRRNRAVTWPDKDGNMREWPSIAELARHYGLTRERMRQIVNEAADHEQAQN